VSIFIATAIKIKKRYFEARTLNNLENKVKKKNENTVVIDKKVKKAR
jgi:hypothetical protein